MSLINFISEWDPLPDDWELRGRSHSVDDVPLLEEHLKAIHGLVPLLRTEAISVDTRILPKLTSFHQGTLSLYMKGEATNTFIDSFMAWCREKQGQVAQNISKISLSISTIITRNYTYRQSLTLFEQLTFAFRESLSFAWGIVSTSYTLIGILYQVFKRPLTVSTAFVLVMLLLLNSFATVYTLCTGNVLDTFCPKKLPVLRNLICSSWDILQDSMLQDSKELAVPAKSTFNPIYVHYLESEDSTISYKLPHYLSLWEQAIRSFRASLPESEYSLVEQRRFYEIFTAYVEQSTYATKNAHRFYAHIMGTINHHVSDTRWLVQKLQDHGPSSNITLYVSGPLAQSMEFFNNYNMVYLPLGLQPFQQNIMHRSTLTALDLMKAHVGAIMQRLSDDILIINVLQTSLNNLAHSSDAIQHQTSRLYAENRRASVMRTPSWWETLSNSLQYRLDKYTIDRQNAWLQDLRPLVQDFAGRLRIMATEFQQAAELCHNFRERLHVEGRAARYGWEVSDWITEQARELADGFADLQSGLQHFKEEKIRFDEGIFRQASVA